ncbi:MAG: chemotaxis protein CheW, partial [Candidatus Desulforudaceae bacterium]
YEIIRMESLTAIPRAPEFVEGVINLRGQIIPVIDLRKRFGLPKAEQTRSSRIIIVEMNEMRVGLTVDAVLEVLDLGVGTINPPPPVVQGGVDSAFLQGIALVKERLVVLLAVDSILIKKERDALKKAGRELETTTG